ncbi:MAG: hypothetical protein HKN23_00570 [Verrucomicrobiales bacterium]|nr:hypothetical protein [Verrucomicrobiales bacterium]
MFKKITVSVAAIAMSFSMTSCGPNSKQGAVMGGLLGAGAGAIIGNQSGRGLEGAAIGGALGATAGAVAGSARDDREQQYRNPPPPPPRRGGYYPY